MAREGREGQGLQIAVIIFAMLTIILAVTTYIFYAQGQHALREKAQADAAAAAKQQEYDKLFYKARAMQMVLGLGGVGDPEVQLAKGKPGVGEDQEVNDLLATYKSDMGLVADQVAATEAKNYRTVANILMGVVNKKNASVTDANTQSRDIQSKTTAALAAGDARTKTFEEAAAKANSDKDTVTSDYAAARAAMEAEKAKIEQMLTATTKKASDDNARFAKMVADAQANENKARNTIEAQLKRLEELEVGTGDLFENPDGKITLASQRQRLVWLNLGRADGLMRQTTFAVYDHDENGVASAEPKGRIEVVEVTGDHTSEARILEDKASNPIVQGDIVHTPSWSPGQRIHFALAGKMDINGDGLDDLEMVKNIIRINGGVIDAEMLPDGRREGQLTVNTRYLVLGATPDERDQANKNLLDSFTRIQEDINRFGTDPISVQKLLQMMGWKSEEKTVELAGTRGGGEFRQRGPGKTAAPKTTPAPGATPAPATTPAPAATPAPGGAIDPFATPAAPAADPFATPAPKAATPAAADPFATPAPKAAAPTADPFATPTPKAAP
jgi:hypothetical protein